MSYGFDLHPEVLELTPSSSASTDGASGDTEVDPDLHAGTDPQLLKYVKERAMTWEDLRNRPPLFPGEVVPGNFLVLNRSFVASGIDALPDTFLMRS
jgi:hypothetical protein